MLAPKRSQTWCAAGRKAEFSPKCLGLEIGFHRIADHRRYDASLPPAQLPSNRFPVLLGFYVAKVSVQFETNSASRIDPACAILLRRIPGSLALLIESVVI
jgi:hypothetical protein